jgi:hypothetical protein
LLPWESEFSFLVQTNMDKTSFFGSAPLWIIFAATVAIIVLSIYSGIFISRLRRKNSTIEDDLPVDTIVGATLALLGFMLAFTFGFTASRFDSKKQLLLDEVNSIGTTYLRAGFLPEPHCNEVRNLIRKYVDLRVVLTEHPEKLKTIIEQSVSLQDEMWKHAEAVAKADLKNPDIISLFMESLNETIDMQTNRITVGLVYRIPDIIWYSIISLLIISMFEVGYLFMKSQKSNWIIILALSLAFSLVILMVITFDRSDKIKINQQPMFELQKSLNK